MSWSYCAKAIMWQICSWQWHMWPRTHIPMHILDVTYLYLLHNTYRRAMARPTLSSVTWIIACEWHLNSTDLWRCWQRAGRRLPVSPDRWGLAESAGSGPWLPELAAEGPPPPRSSWRELGLCQQTTGNSADKSDIPGPNTDWCWQYRVVVVTWRWLCMSVSLREWRTMNQVGGQVQSTPHLPVPSRGFDVTAITTGSTALINPFVTSVVGQNLTAIRILLFFRFKADTIPAWTNPDQHVRRQRAA